MSTISTPLLKDGTLSSVSVTGLFRGGVVFIRDATYKTINANTAVFDTLNVNNLIVNGTASNSQVSNPQLGLVPNQLVATNASGTPVSFPYGSLANEIAVRDSNGSISFSNWVTDVTTTFPFFMPTGSGTGYNVGFSGTVNTTLTVPDVGVDANIVVFGNNNVKNVIASGDNILHLQSTTGTAKFAIGSNALLQSTNSAAFALNGTVEATIQHFVTGTATNTLSVLDSKNYAQVTMSGGFAPNPFILCGGPVQLIQSGNGGLSNANRASFKAVFLNSSVGTSSTNFTTGVTVNNGGATQFIVNTSQADSIGIGASKSFVWTNSFIGTNSKFVVSIQDLLGSLNTTNVGVPHAIISSVSPGSATVTIYNISTSQQLRTQVTIACLLFP